MCVNRKEPYSRTVCLSDILRRNTGFLPIRFEMNILSAAPNGLTQARANIFRTLHVNDIYIASSYMKSIKAGL